MGSELRRAAASPPCCRAHVGPPLCILALVAHFSASPTRAPCGKLTWRSSGASCLASTVSGTELNTSRMEGSSARGCGSRSTGNAARRPAVASADAASAIVQSRSEAKTAGLQVLQVGEFGWADKGVGRIRPEDKLMDFARHAFQSTTQLAAAHDPPLPASAAHPFIRATAVSSLSRCCKRRRRWRHTAAAASPLVSCAA